MVLLSLDLEFFVRKSDIFIRWNDHLRKLRIFSTCFSLHVNLLLHRWWKDVSRSRSFWGIFSSTLICHFTSQKLLNILNVKLVIVSGKQSCLSTQDTLKSQQGSKGGSREASLWVDMCLSKSRAKSSHFSDGRKPR